MGIYRKQTLLLISILLSPASLITVGQNTDIKILREINQAGNGQLLHLNQMVSDFTTPVVISTLVLLLVFSLYKKNQKLRDRFVVVTISVLFAYIASNLIKIIVQRPRPFDTFIDIIKYGDGGSFSFPSGHTSEAFAFATAISLAYRKWYIVIPVYLWACMVGFSRMYLGTHYPSDVLAGIFIGMLSSWLCFQAGQWYKKNSNPKIV
jgi:membrane-associated phospholipid phosphatase